MSVTIRRQKVSDAKRFYEILTNPNFIYFPIKPRSIKDEIDFLKQTRSNWQIGKNFNFSILFKKAVVGAIGVRINSIRPYICEIGYFVDEKYWNIGIASKALQLLNKFIVSKIPNIKRIELMTASRNTGSQKVATKNGYKKEGTLRSHLLVNGKYYNSYLYSKIV
jgi:RimJ/RimL family protein N-acetyltransferase